MKEIFRPNVHLVERPAAKHREPVYYAEMRCHAQVRHERRIDRSIRVVSTLPRSRWELCFLYHNLIYTKHQSRNTVIKVVSIKLRN